MWTAPLGTFPYKIGRKLIVRLRGRKDTPHLDQIFGVLHCNHGSVSGTIGPSQSLANGYGEVNRFL